MQKAFATILGILCTLIVSITVSDVLRAQQPAARIEESLRAEDFTKILKDEWSFLKDRTDEFLAASAKRTEFETTKEYGDRVAGVKAALVNKVSNHIREMKLDRRIFLVYFKTSLIAYNADLQQYQISGGSTIEAPYDIPSLKCVVPPNPYLVIADSVVRGFRSSALRIQLPPDYRWKVARDEARMAKGEEPSLFFRVRFVLDLRQDDMVKQAKLRIIPLDIAMMNTMSKKIYWTDQIK
jgi:hypothetical protein